ncbi:MAG: transporter substrate-binding domain-containing protein [Ruthenibacterium sp.]
MKKVFALTLVLLMALSLVACAGAAPASTAASAAAGNVGAGATIATLEDLNGKKIGVQLGTTGDIYAQDIEGAEIKQFNKGADAVLALKQGKIDAVIIDNEPAKVFASKNPEMTILPEDFAVEDYAICISKDKADLTAKINGAIAEIKKDGTLQSILDKYINGKTDAGYKTPEGTAYPNGKLTMATNAYFPPYEYYEGEDIIGIDADFAKAICDKLGYELEIKDMEFDSIVPTVQSGKADFGAAGMTVTEDRLKSIDFTDSYCTGIQSVIVLK